MPLNKGEDLRDIDNGLMAMAKSKGKADNLDAYLVLRENCRF